MAIPYVNPPTVRKQEVGWTGKYFERAIQKQLYAFGGTATNLVAANAIATGLSATAQPVLGLYNPKDSGKNLIVLQAAIIVNSVAATTALPGAFNWVFSTAQVISTGTAGTCRYLGAQTTPTSAGLGFAQSTALTGLSGNLTNTNIPMAVGSVVTAQPGTATSMFGSPWVESNEGSWIIAPGCFLGVMNQFSTTTVSVAASIMWAELPIEG